MMSVSDEIGKLSEDCLALELRELNLRIDVLESESCKEILRVNESATGRRKGIDIRFDEAEGRAAERHMQTMRALELLADTSSLRERVVCLEARKLTRARG
jgi:hypothetical protein